MQVANRKFYEDFGTRIRVIREKRGLSLAELSGGTASTANSWQNGSLPRADRWDEIAKRLQVSSSFLISGKPIFDEDYEFIAKYRDEIGSPPGERAGAVGENRRSYAISEPLPVHESGRSHANKREISGEDPLSEIRAHMGLLLGAAGNDRDRLGWIAEQLRIHLRVPPHWRRSTASEGKTTTDELLAEAERLLRERERESSSESTERAS